MPSNLARRTPPAAAAEGPVIAYKARLRDGAIKPDAPQAKAAALLQRLHDELKGYRPPAPASAGGWLQRLGLAPRARPEPPLRGVYLYGSVGRGKSMLMDLFFETAPVANKRRVHFHGFMLEVHERIHAWRQANRAEGEAKGVDDALPQLAAQIADEALLLCFDEFQVTDVADAMILGRLFTALFERGVVVVATSNFPPDRLYEGGLTRDRFLPFIALLKERLEVFELAGETDHRLARLKGMEVYHSPLGPAATAKLEAAFARLADDDSGRPCTLEMKGRKLIVPRAAHGVAWFSYPELCQKPLGAADYLKIAATFGTVILDGVPRLDPNRRDEARRLMTLIDELYEHKTKLIIAAEAPPDRLYPAGKHAFEFERTVSRLMEMQAQDYLDTPHKSEQQASE